MPSFTALPTTLALATGLLALAATVLAGLAYRHAPTRTSCPECGRRTATVRVPRLLQRARAARRWCAECGWEGLGRDGPEWRPGEPLAHDSGFFWGQERLPEDFGFQWARSMSEASAAPPHHPSGFRFGGPGGDSAPAVPEVASSAPDVERVHPSGFRWADDGPNGPGFRWGQAAPKPDDPPFRWRKPA